MTGSLYYNVDRLILWLAFSNFICAYQQWLFVLINLVWKTMLRLQLKISFSLPKLAFQNWPLAVNILMLVKFSRYISSSVSELNVVVALLCTRLVAFTYLGWIAYFGQLNYMASIAPQVKPQPMSSNLFRNTWPQQFK